MSDERSLKRWMVSLLDSIKDRLRKPEPQTPQPPRPPEGYDDVELTRDGHFWIKVVRDE